MPMISLNRLTLKHRPSMRGERKDHWGKAPIIVKRRMFAWFYVIDGMDRVYYARQRGDTHINAVIQK